jgi:hypothetical protein
LSAARRAPWALLAAIVIFVSLGLYITQRLPAGHEEISTFPARPARVMVWRDERAVLEPSCADANPPSFVASEARPTASVCASGLGLPVLIAPYAAGVPYWHSLVGWPLHRGEIFALRRWNLLAGVLSLVLLHRLARRLEGQLFADVAVLVMAGSPAFLLLHCLLLQYESTPWMLVVAALLAATARRYPSPLRLIGAGLLFGLALVANVKAMFFLPVALAIAWRLRAFERFGSPRFVAGLVGIVVGFLPLLLLNRTQRDGGLSAQLSHRLTLLLSGSSLRELALEVVNLVRFAADTASYSGADWRPTGVVGGLSIAVFALALTWAGAELGRVAVRRRGSALVAAAGLASLGWVFVSLLLYDQRPAANYAPLYALFAAAVAGGLVQVARLARSRSWVERETPLAYGLALGVALVGSLSLLVRIAQAGTLPITIDAGAERALAAHLLAHRDGATLYTTTYNLGGVLDSLGRGDLSSVRLDRVLACPDTAPEREGCLDERWRAILRREGAVPALVVVPALEAFTDEPSALGIEPALRRAALGLGLRVSTEADFPLGARPEAPALRLLRLQPSAGPTARE